MCKVGIKNVSLTGSFLRLNGILDVKALDRLFII